MGLFRDARRGASAAVAAVLSIALVAGVLASGAAATKPTVVRAGNLVVRLNGGVTPKRLSRSRLQPISLNASANLATTDGSHPPAARTVTIDFDRQGAIEAHGLATCRASALQSRSTRAAKRACPKAIVGKGSTTVQVAFPEQRPFSSTGPLVLFNGGVRHGVTTILIHAYVKVPAPTAIVTTVRVKKIHAGRYGTRAVAAIPRIAGGSGSVIRFSFRIHRTFRAHGHSRSYLAARCGNGRFYAHATIAFADGTRAAGTIVRPCQAKR
jgi:hypothetical protein